MGASVSLCVYVSVYQCVYVCENVCVSVLHVCETVSICVSVRECKYM